MSKGMLIAAMVAGAGCAAGPKVAAPPAAPAPRLLPEETAFLSDLRQLTFGGENAEAYWSFDGTQLSFQARQVNEGCDRIYKMSVDAAAAPAPVRISSGKGATTCPH